MNNPIFTTGIPELDTLLGLKAETNSKHDQLPPTGGTPNPPPHAAAGLQNRSGDQFNSAGPAAGAGGIVIMLDV